MAARKSYCVFMTAGTYSETLGRRGFQPFIWTQFLGAFNDNLFKIVVSLLAVRVAATSADASFQLSLVGAIFILPFVLFSGYAGQVADIYSKRTVLVVTKSRDHVRRPVPVRAAGNLLQPGEVRNSPGDAAGFGAVACERRARDDDVRRDRARHRVWQLHVRRLAPPALSRRHHCRPDRGRRHRPELPDPGCPGCVAWPACDGESVERNLSRIETSQRRPRPVAHGDRHLVLLVSRRAAAARHGALRDGGDGAERPLGRRPSDVRGDRDRGREHGGRPSVGRQSGAWARADRIDWHGRVRDPALARRPLVHARGRRSRARRLLRRSLCRSLERAAAAAERRAGKGPPHGDQQRAQHARHPAGVRRAVALFVSARVRDVAGSDPLHLRRADARCEHLHPAGRSCIPDPLLSVAPHAHDLPDSHRGPAARAVPRTGAARVQPPVARRWSARRRVRAAFHPVPRVPAVLRALGIPSAVEADESDSGRRRP